jgi:hypothetical protein
MGANTKPAVLCVECGDHTATDGPFCGHCMRAQVAFESAAIDAFALDYDAVADETIFVRRLAESAERYYAY